MHGLRAWSHVMVFVVFDLIVFTSTLEILVFLGV